MPDLHFNEESDYSEESAIENEHIRSKILQPFLFEHEQKKYMVMRNMRSKLNIFTLWCTCRHCKNEAREIECRCCREIDKMFFASWSVSEASLSC